MREGFRLNDWILQGAIIGVIIGALLGLAGDPLIELIDSLIGGSRTSASEETISSTDEESRLKQDIEKEIREEIEPIIPLKKWQQENQEDEIKQSRKCDDLFQDWNNLCSWFRDKSQSLWQQKVDADNEIQELKQDVDRARASLDGDRSGLQDSRAVEVAFTGAGLIHCGLEFAAAEAPVWLMGIFGTASDAEVAHTIIDWGTEEEAKLDKREQEIKQFRRQRLNEIQGRLKKLQDEYINNRSRLLQIEQLMRDGGCEKIYEKMGHTGIPTKCPYVDTANWQWIDSIYGKKGSVFGRKG
jgi:hypothetical protein